MDRLAFACVFLLIGFVLGWLLKPDVALQQTATTLNTSENSTTGFSINSEANTPANPSAEYSLSSGTNPQANPASNQQAPQQRANPASQIKEELTEPTHESVLEKFRWLLNNNRNREAVDYFQEIERRQPPLAAALKRELIKILELKLKSGEFASFSSLAEYWLAAYYSDLDVLLLLAEYNNLQNYFGEAINLYQIIYSYAANEGELAAIDTQFANFVHARDARLIENQLWQELQSFYELIEQADIAKPANRYRLAEIYLHNGLLDDARYLLQELANGGVYKSRAEKLLAEIGTGEYENKPFRSLGQQSIPLQRMGHHFIAALNLQNNVQLKLLVDTGASITSVSQSAFADKMNYVNHSFSASRLFHTANGIVRGEVLQVPAVYFGGFELQNVELAIVPMPENPDVDGLLGMNILSQFRFHIDQDTAELVLDKK